MVSSRTYAAMVETVAATGRAATDPPLMTFRHGGSSELDLTLAALARDMNCKVLTLAAETRRAAHDLENTFFFGAAADTTSSKIDREAR